jgi:hypothetical protein
VKIGAFLGRGLLAAALGGASGIRAAESASLEELFKWGEYDSLIHVLEPPRSSAQEDSILGHLATRADSVEEAKARMYLGVAYWAKGRTEAGSRTFLQATRLDRGLRLDPLYATTEMAAHFERLAEAGQKILIPAVPQGPPPPGGKTPERRKAAPRRWLVWSGVAGAAVAGTFTGIYFLNRSQRPNEITTVIDPDRAP